MSRPTKLRALRAKRFVVRLNTGAEYRKLMTFGFTSDGSFWASVPYFRAGPGLLAELTMEAGVVGPVDLSLADAGKVTINRVKYSHHRSGEAHFSLTDKVQTLIRRQSVPLSTIDGHLLTIQLQGFDGFEEDNERRPDEPWETDHRRRTVTFGPPPPGTQAIKIVLRCSANRLLKKRVRGSALGPWTQMQDQDGRSKQGLLVSGPERTPGSSTFLLLTLEPIPALSDQPTAFSLIGGFDPPKVSKDPAKPTGFLAMIYPAERYDELLARIGSVDIQPAANDRGEPLGDDEQPLFSFPLDLYQLSAYAALPEGLGAGS